MTKVDFITRKKKKSLADQYPDNEFTPVVKLYTKHKHQKLLIFSDGSCVFEFRKEPLWVVIDKYRLMKLIIDELPKDIRKFVRNAPAATRTKSKS